MTEDGVALLFPVRCPHLNQAGIITNERNLLSQKGEACPDDSTLSDSRRVAHHVEGMN